MFKIIYYFLILVIFSILFHYIFIHLNVSQQIKTYYNLDNPNKIISLKNTPIYYLTTDFQGERSRHIQQIFNDYHLLGFLPELGIHKQKSGASGFSRILKYGLKTQIHYTDFKPFIILEDDVSHFRPWPITLSYPVDCDILFIGLSTVGLQQGKDFHEYGIYFHHINKDIIRIYNMLSTHGIMVCSYFGVKILIQCMIDAYQTGIPWDIFTAMIQPYCKTYALKIPIVYQDKQYNGAEDGTKIVFEPKNNKENYFQDLIHQERLHKYQCIRFAKKII